MRYGVFCTYYLIMKLFTVTLRVLKGDAVVKHQIRGIARGLEHLLSICQTVGWVIVKSEHAVTSL